jgi:hypothetical protein
MCKEAPLGSVASLSVEAGSLTGRGIRISIVLFHRSQFVVIHVPTNIPAETFARILIRAEVYPTKHTSVGDVVDDVS